MVIGQPLWSLYFLVKLRDHFRAIHCQHINGHILISPAVYSVMLMLLQKLVARLS